MAKYRHALPQTRGGWFLTDGGIETTLIYHDGLELPEFAAFVLLDAADGREALRRYYRRYLEIAASARTGFVLESPTWRAGFDWGAKLGYDERAMQRFNRDGVELMHELRRIGSDGRGDRDQRLHRAAWRRLPTRRTDVRRRRAARPSTASARAGGARRRPAHRDHDDDERRSDRRRARRRAGGPALRDLVHGRDRRPPAERRDAARRDRSDGSRERRAAGLLHGELRPPDTFRCRSAARIGRGASGACAPTPLRSATPSSTDDTLDAGDPVDFGERHRRAAREASRTSASSAAAAAPITGTSRRSARHVFRRRRSVRDQKNGRDRSRPFSFSLTSPQRGGAVPGGGGGSEAWPPLSSGVMLRTVTRRLIALGPSRLLLQILLAIALRRQVLRRHAELLRQQRGGDPRGGPTATDCRRRCRPRRCGPRSGTPRADWPGSHG